MLYASSPMTASCFKVTRYDAGWPHTVPLSGLPSPSPVP
jgi:hypothetical protein